MGVGVESATGHAGCIKLHAKDFTSMEKQRGHLGVVTRGEAIAARVKGWGCSLWTDEVRSHTVNIAARPIVKFDAEPPAEEAEPKPGAVRCPDAKVQARTGGR